MARHWKVMRDKRSAIVGGVLERHYAYNKKTRPVTGKLLVFDDHFTMITFMGNYSYMPSIQYSYARCQVESPEPVRTVMNPLVLIMPAPDARLALVKHFWEPFPAVRYWMPDFLELKDVTNAIHRGVSGDAIRLHIAAPPHTVGVDSVTPLAPGRGSE